MNAMVRILEWPARAERRSAAGAVGRGLARRAPWAASRWRFPGFRSRDRFARCRCRRPVFRAQGRGDRRPPLRRRRLRQGRDRRGGRSRRWRDRTSWWRIPPRHWWRWARRRASAARRRVIGVTGSVGKTGVKEAIFAALDRVAAGGYAAHRSVKSYNNHVGVPLSLARMPARSRFGVFEMGMNHAGEIAGADRAGPPACRGDHHHRSRPHREPGQRWRQSPTPRRDFRGAGARRCRNHPRRQPLLCPAEGQRPNATKARSSPSAGQPMPHVRLLDAVPASGGGSLVTADLGDRRLCYTVAAPGEHWVIEFACGHGRGARGGRRSWRGWPCACRNGGARRPRRAASKFRCKDGAALLIDESYNANPASMRATLAQLGKTGARAASRCWGR